MKTWIDKYQRLAAATPERGQAPREHFDEWLARAQRLGDLRKTDAYVLEMLFEIQQMLADRPRAEDPWLKLQQELQFCSDTLRRARDQYAPDSWEYAALEAGMERLK